VTESERYAEADAIATWGVANAARFAPIRSDEPDARKPVSLVPANLANAWVPRRNLCAEFGALATEQLLAEADHAMRRLAAPGEPEKARPTDYAVVAALTQRVCKLDKALVQLAFMAASTGKPTRELQAACEGAIKLSGSAQ